MPLGKREAIVTANKHSPIGGRGPLGISLFFLFLFATSSNAFASPLPSRYYHDTYDKGAVRLVIGAANGRRYFLIINYGASSQGVTVFLGDDFDQASDDRSMQQHFMMDGLSMTGLRFLDEIAGDPRFVSAWNLGVPGDEYAEPILRNENSDVNSTLDHNTQPIIRSPPDYPSKCEKGSNPIERVHVRFDVTATGNVENIEVIETTNDCFNEPTLRSVKKWIYLPRFDGHGWTRRRGVETVLEFRLSTQIIRKP